MVPAAHGVALEAERAVEVGAVHGAIFDEDVAAAAGDFATDDHAAVAVFHGAAAHDDVFRGHVDAAAVAVAAGFDRDAIVAGVEDAVFDEDVAARFRITSVVVGAVGIDRETAHGDVSGKYGVNFPHGRADDRDALDEDVFTTVGLNKIGP